jgi:CsoR family transcriptional regulator, copper-sensing transcriptional repressor
MRGYYQDKDQVITRLRKLEGQIRGLQRMVYADEYCIDILTQVSAVTAGLKKVAVRLLDDHIRHCVAESLSNGGDADSTIGDATAAVERLLKS